jgi:hypothetical protein
MYAMTLDPTIDATTTDLAVGVPAPENAVPEAVPAVVAPAEQAAPETPEEPIADATPRPRRADRHVANLTARLAATETERANAERRAEAAEALLQAGSAGESPAQPSRPSMDRESVRAEIEFDDRRRKLIETGRTEYPDWDEKTTIVHSFGGTQNAAFMAAIVEVTNGPKIIAALADDTDLLVDLLKKSPAAMAAALGRLDAKMEQTVAKPISRAPAPAPRIEPSSVVKEPDIYDENLDMKTWAKLWDKRAPPHLRGYWRPYR